MSWTITLSVVGTVMTFLISTLNSFPVSDVEPTTYDLSDESYNEEAADEISRLFTGNYNSLIDEMISYQTNPDYHRAEAKRQEMVEVGNDISNKLGVFAQRMQGDLDNLTNQVGSQ